MRRLNRFLTIATITFAGALAGVIDQAGAAELNVISAGAMRSSLQELAPEFEKTSGHKLKIEYGTAGAVEKKAAAEDAEYDVVILTKPRMDDLVKKAKIAGGATAVLFRAPIGCRGQGGRAETRYQLGREVQAGSAQCQVDRLCRPGERRHQRHSYRQGHRKARHRRSGQIEDQAGLRQRRAELAAGRRSRRARRGRDRDPADQRAERGQGHHGGRSAARRSAKPGSGLCRRVADAERAAGRGQGADRFPQRTQGRRGLQIQGRAADVT